MQFILCFFLDGYAQHYTWEKIVSTSTTQRPYGMCFDSLQNPIFYCLDFVLRKQIDNKIVDLLTLDKSGFVGPAVDISSNGNIYIGNGPKLLMITPDIKVKTIDSGFSRVFNLKFVKNGKLYIIDDKENKLWLYDTASNSKTLILSEPSDNQEYQTTGIAFDSGYSHIYLAGYESHIIKKYALNEDGTINGTGELITSNTTDIFNLAVDNSGKIYAPLVYSNKIMVIDTNKEKTEINIQPSLNEVIGVILKGTNNQKMLYLSADPGILKINLDSLVKDSPANINVNKVSNNNSNLLYPNSAKEKLHITLSEAFESHGILTIYNLSGNIMMQNEINENKFNIDVSPLKTGIYLLHVSCNNGRIYCQKFNKE